MEEINAFFYSCGSESHEYAYEQEKKRTQSSEPSTEPSEEPAEEPAGEPSSEFVGSYGPLCGRRHNCARDANGLACWGFLRCRSTRRLRRHSLRSLPALAQLCQNPNGRSLLGLSRSRSRPVRCSNGSVSIHLSWAVPHLWNNQPQRLCAGGVGAIETTDNAILQRALFPNFAGGEHTCALSTTGTIECWGCGDNNQGQCEAPKRQLCWKMSEWVTPLVPIKEMFSAGDETIQRERPSWCHIHSNRSRAHSAVAVMGWVLPTAGDAMLDLGKSRTM